VLTEAPPQPLRAIGRRVPLPTERLTLRDLGRPLFAIVVYGDPAPQGSKTGFVNPKTQRVVLKESSAAVKPWRAAVLKAAQEARPHGWVAMDGPLVADMVVTMPRPKSAPKTLRTLPSPFPDLSKLCRSTEDALGEDSIKLGRPIIADDARIVEYRRLAKVYEGDPWDPDALRQPGAVIRLWHYPEHLLGKIATIEERTLIARG
jgi:hypothetical protein